MHFFRLLASACVIALLAGCAATAPDKNDRSLGIRASNVDTNLFQATAGGRLGLNAPSDIWERIRSGFSMPDLDNSIVRERENWYMRNPGSVSRLIGRSDKYIYHVMEELERRQMPTELALLPFVESAFNPNATSSAKAAGLWQFIPSTGRHYSLAQNRFLDDRRDILRSTSAALDYLQRLYEMFGDWHLALASYNWGEGNVQRAIQRNIAAGRGTSYSDLNMPLETRQYVPKLQALKNIIRNPATFDTSLPNVSNTPYFHRVEIDRDIDVATVARLAEISEEDVKALNPSLSKPLVIASLTPRILLPATAVPRFRENLERAKDSQLSSWTLWTVPTTMSVAEAAKQAGTTEEQLRAINRIPPHMRVTAGSALLVPRPYGHTGDISRLAARNSSLTFAPEVALRRITLKAQEDETVTSFARRLDLAAQDVAQWNGLATGSALQAGQQLVVNVPQQQANRLLNQQRADEALAARKSRHTARGRQAQGDDEEASPRTRRQKAGKQQAAEKPLTRKQRQAASRDADQQDTKRPEKRKGKANQQDDEKPVTRKQRQAVNRDNEVEKPAPRKGGRHADKEKPAGKPAAKASGKKTSNKDQ